MTVVSSESNDLTIRTVIRGINHIFCDCLPPTQLQAGPCKTKDLAGLSRDTSRHRQRRSVRTEYNVMHDLQQRLQTASELQRRETIDLNSVSRARYQRITLSVGREGSDRSELVFGRSHPRQ